MFWQRINGNGPYDRSVAAGVLSDLDPPIQIKEHICVEDTQDGGSSTWLLSANGRPIPRYAGCDRDKPLPPDWLGSNHISAEKSESGELETQEHLEVHCLCRGVDFLIERPNEHSASFDAPFPDVIPTAEHGSRNQHWWLPKKRCYAAGTCACRTCRLAAGVEIVEWAFVPEANLKLLNGSDMRFDIGTLKPYQSREDVVRYFCGTCGAMAIYTSKNRKGVIDVAVGLLNARSGARAEEWLDWETKRVSYREDADQRGLAGLVEQNLRVWGECKVNNKKD